MPKRSIGKNILKVRTDAGMSQTDIEAITGIGKSRLSRYENEHIVPTVKTIEILAEAMGVRPATLTGWE